MKKYAILVVNPEGYEGRRLAEEIRKLGFEACLIEVEQMRVVVGRSEIYHQNQLLDVDWEGVIVTATRGIRTNFESVVSLLIGEVTKESRVLNGRSLRSGNDFDKLWQMMELTKQKIPVPWTITLEHELPKELFPLVVKPTLGSLGIGVRLIQDQGEWESFRKEKKVGEWMGQEVLPPGKDYRVLVLGNKVLGVMERRAAEGKFVANFSQGGAVRMVELGQKVEEIALKASRTLGLEYAGVDLMKSAKGEWRVIEVNRCAHFEGFEKATGVNVAKEIVSYLQAGKKG